MIDEDIRNRSFDSILDMSDEGLATTVPPSEGGALLRCTKPLRRISARCQVICSDVSTTNNRKHSSSDTRKMR